MKRKHIVRAGLAALIAQLLLFSAPWAAADAQGAQADGNTAGMQAVVQYGFQPLPDRDALYRIDLDRLWAEESLTGADAQNGYAAYYGKLQAVHGEPSAVSQAQLADLVSQIGADTQWAENVSRAAAWDLGFGQTLFLIDTGGESMLFAYVPAAGTAQANAGLPDGVSWNLTEDGMKTLEGVSDDAQLNAYSFDGGVQYSFTRQNEYGSTAYTQYIFKQDRLVMFGSNTNEYCYPEDTDMQAVFDAWHASLNETYGEPSTLDPQGFLSQYNTLDGCGLDAENVTDFAGWQLKDDTDLYLVNLYGSNILSLYTNPQRLSGGAQGGDAQTVAAQSEEVNAYEQGIRDYLRYGFIRQDGGAAYVVLVINLGAMFGGSDSSATT